MAQSTAYWLMITAIIVLIQSTVAYKSINEVCSTASSRPDDPQKCDPAAFLKCGGNRLCSCDSSLVWSEALGQCAYSVDERCADNYGNPVFPGGSSQGGNGPAPGCPRNAECDARESKRCRCKSGFVPNESNTECNGASNVHFSFLTVVSIVVSSMFALKALC